MHMRSVQNHSQARQKITGSSIMHAILKQALPLSLSFVLASGAALAATDPAQMKARYDRAALIGNNEENRYYLNHLVLPNWIRGEDRFWYKRETKDGYRFIVIDAATGRSAEAFDHARLAAALQAVSGRKISEHQLPLRKLTLEKSGALSFLAFDKAWFYDGNGQVTERAAAAEASTELAAPDGSAVAFLRDYDIWVRDLKTGKERQLTKDGERYYAYGMAADVFRRGGRLEARWSPDASKLLTVQVDDRQVLELPAVQFAPEGSIRPVAVSQRIALPGDEHVPAFRIAIIDVKSGKQTPVHYGTIPAVRMNDTPIGGNRAWWSGDGASAYFVDVARGEKVVRVIAVDAASGETREVFAERADSSYVELAQNVYGPATLALLPKSNQLIWYSERSGWAQLYLYDLKTGAMVRRLTRGDWVVRDILHVDEARREAIIAIAGRSANKNPYYQEIARIGLDDASFKVLSSGDDDRQVIGPGNFEATAERVMFEPDPDLFTGAAPSGKYFVESQTRPDALTRTVLRRRDGSEVAVVEMATTAGLPEGFRWPEEATVTAADGSTKVRALVFRPSDFSQDRKYPIIDHIYGGPQVFYAPTSFAGVAATAQAVAELGFIVTVIDGRGTTGRSRAFHEASYGKIETASNIEDHIAGLKQLAQRYRYIDIERVGIFGFSGGGYMTARAMFAYPDFFDVGVAGAGNHDQRLFWNTWGERYNGLLDGDNFVAQANVTHAKNLKGRLFLIHGMVDIGVHPGNVFQVIQALMDANKDFDLLLLPRAAHALPGYALRRQWDYFVRNLAGETPPENYPVRSSSDAGEAMARRLMVGDAAEDKKP